jgi:phage shock protein PspC (stress-responsive transcriptional regulator)
MSACHHVGMANALVRPRQGKMLGGVCVAIARRFGISTGLVRALFVISIILPGPQILLYLGLWIFLPSE